MSQACAQGLGTDLSPFPESGNSTHILDLEKSWTGCGWELLSQIHIWDIFFPDLHPRGFGLWEGGGGRLISVPVNWRNAFLDCSACLPLCQDCGPGPRAPSATGAVQPYTRKSLQPQHPGACALSSCCWSSPGTQGRKGLGRVTWSSGDGDMSLSESEVPPFT